MTQLFFGRQTVSAKQESQLKLREKLSKYNC